MRSRWLFVGLLVVSTALVTQACGDDDAPPPTTTDAGADATPSSNDASPVQDAGSESTATCPEACSQTATSSACVGKTYNEATCQRFCPCVVGAFRASLVSGALACISGCRDGGGEDKCLANNAAPYADDPEVEAAVVACSSRQSECRDAGTSLGTDVCALSAASPAFLTKVKDCLALPCADARTCITGAYTAAGCKD